MVSTCLLCVPNTLVLGRMTRQPLMIGTHNVSFRVDCHLSHYVTSKVSESLDVKFGGKGDDETFQHFNFSLVILESSLERRLGSIDSGDALFSIDFRNSNESNYYYYID